MCKYQLGYTCNMNNMLLFVIWNKVVNQPKDRAKITLAYSYPKGILYLSKGMFHVFTFTFIKQHKNTSSYCGQFLGNWWSTDTLASIHYFIQIICKLLNALFKLQLKILNICPRYNFDVCINPYDPGDMIITPRKKLA